MSFEGDEVIRRLDTLIRLVAVGVCQEKPQMDSIKILASAGLGPKEIAEMLGTTPNNVSVRLSAARRADKKKPKVAQKVESNPSEFD